MKELEDDWIKIRQEQYSEETVILKLIKFCQETK